MSLKSHPDFPTVRNLNRILERSYDPTCSERCMCPPHPKLADRYQQELEAARKAAKRRKGAAAIGLAEVLEIKRSKPMGFNDGLIVPGNHFPVGTPPHVVRSAAADRSPLTGTVRVVVILAEFSDQSMGETNQHFEDLFFSTGTIATGSAREYFDEVSNGTIDLQGQVVGPLQLPETLADYANGASGTGNTNPNARDMARDAAVAANPLVDFGPYDNDGDGYVDAFVVVHAGAGAEVSGSPDDIWSHKWVLRNGAYSADGTDIYAYLTVPEDANIGVVCHELGHLIFGWPDLYDTDGSSEGIGDWCLMAGGSWNGSPQGTIPAHASAWCKADQGWVSVLNHNTNGPVSIDDVKTSHQVHRLWNNGGPGNEYFLVENRQQSQFDADIPGGGLLIWHIDDSIATNTDEVHPKVALEQADGADHLGAGTNRGDAGDCFPGSTNNASFTDASTPDSKSYGGMDTCVRVTQISAPGATMTAHFAVRCKQFEKGKELRKEVVKEYRKEHRKELKEFKEYRKDQLIEKDPRTEKLRQFDKRVEKPITDKRSGYDKNPATEGKRIDKQIDKQAEKRVDKLAEGGFDPRFEERIRGLEERLSMVESVSAGGNEPFIGEELRPDLRFGALASEEDLALAEKEMAEGSADAKRSFDTKQADS